MTLADKILTFYKDLSVDVKLPAGVKVLNPYRDEKIFSYCVRFYEKFYNSELQRILILGINPGRFGAGITGIPFTDPVKLVNYAGIENDLPQKPELSADFIHAMMEEYGGLKKFYSKYLFSSVSPLGYTQNDKNLNYYDSPKLAKSLEPFILRSINQLLDLGVDRGLAYCLGEGSNFKYLSSMNNKHRFFETIVPLTHPRFIMQYRRKFLNDYIEDYLTKLK